MRTKRLSVAEEAALLRTILDPDQPLEAVKHARALLVQVSGEASSPRERPPREERVRLRMAVRAVVRLVQGARLSDLADELRVDPRSLAHWRDAFFEGGHASLERAVRDPPAPGLA